MKTLKNALLLVLLAASCLALAAGEETKSEKGQLQFTISDEPKEWDASWEQAMQIEKPTHVAVLQLDNLRIWKSPWVRLIASVRGESKRSLERVAFTAEGSLTQPYEFLLSREDPGPQRFKFWLYATSEKEARKMAEALIDGAKSLAYAYVRRAEAQLEDCRKSITDYENEIPKIDEDKKTAEAQFDEIKKATYYRNKDEAQKSILEWNNLLNVVEVDIIGIRAKLDMINQLKQKQTKTEEVDGMTFVSDGGTLWSLDKMRMSEEIELAGALARKNAAQLYRKKALDFLDSAERFDNLLEQLEAKQNQLSRDRDVVKKTERRLPQFRADAKPVEVVDNEVKIHPVK